MEETNHTSNETRTLTIIRIKPHCKPEVIIIPDTLESLQHEVGGYIEAVYLSPSAVIIVNEEGKLQHLPPNRRFYNDILVGNILIIGKEGEELISLTPEQITLYMKQFETPESIDPSEVRKVPYEYHFFF